MCPLRKNIHSKLTLAWKTQHLLQEVLQRAGERAKKLLCKALPGTTTEGKVVAGCFMMMLLLGWYHMPWHCDLYCSYQNYLLTVYGAGLYFGIFIMLLHKK